MSNIVIEANLENTSNKISNAEWLNTFEPIEIATGDTITLRNAFIDTNKLSGDNIVIPNDLTMLFQYYIYDINNSNTDKAHHNYAGQSTKDYAIYWSMKVDTQDYSKNEPETYEHTITLPAASYSPQGLASKISDLLNIGYVNNGGNFEATFMRGSNGVHYWANFINEAGFLPHPGPNQANPTASSTRWYVYDGQRSYWVGASNVVLTFDTDKQLFEFSYMHMPYLNAGHMAVHMAYDADGWHEVKQQSGIAWKRLLVTDTVTNEEVDFWEGLLGFDLSQKGGLIQPLFYEDDPIGGGYIKYGTEVITSAYLAQSGLMNPTGAKHFPALPEAPHYGGFYSDTTVTNGLLAKRYRADTTGAYYLIEIISNYKSMYEEDKHIRRSIMGICSKQYNSNDYITCTADSSINYTHVDIDSLLLSSVHIRILDPTTKQPVKTLGTKNCLFLEIFKNTTRPILNKK